MTQVEADENHDIRYPNLPMQGDKEGAAILFFLFKKKDRSFRDKQEDAQQF